MASPVNKSKTVIICCKVVMILPSSMCWALNSLSFAALGDGHHNQIVGVYKYPLRRFPIKGGMTIHDVMSLDPGTYR